MKQGLRIEKTYWYDEGLHKTYGHNNQGLIYGINYIDDDIISNCEWFKTKGERNHRLKIARKEVEDENK